MAQLKDSLITGSLRVTDTIYTTNETISSLTASAAVVSDVNKKLVSRTILNNTSAAAVTGSDSLITANTLVNAGYVKSSGVTSITIQTTSPLSGGSATATTNTGSYTIAFSNQAHNTVLAGPSATNASATAPSFRTLVAADIPYITTASDTSNELYMLGVTSSATTTVKYNSGVKAKNGAVTATTYNALTLTAATTGFTIAGGTTSKTLTVAGTATINAPTQGGIVYGGTSGAYSSTDAGTSGQLLQSAGTSAPTWITATNSNTASTIVKRDASGNFSAGTITASLSGTATSSNALAADTTALTNANITHVEKGGVIFKQGGGTVSNSPRTYGSYLHFHWFSANNWDTQLYLPEVHSSSIFWRSHSDTSTWGAWKTILDSSNYGSYTAYTDLLTITKNDNTVTIGSANNGFCHFQNSANIPFYFNKTVQVDGNILPYGTTQTKDLGSSDKEFNNVYGVTFSGGASYIKDWNATGTASGTTTAVVAALQNYFSTAPKGVLTSCRCRTNTHPMAMGYFLSGYNTIATAYGGWFVAHYATPYYVGISNGTWKESQLWKAGDSVTGAVWNDYAEYRRANTTEPGRCVEENDNGTLTLTKYRLIPGASIISDTWGFSQGESEEAKTPVAVSGRVLAYPYRNRDKYHAGQAVCSGPNGTVDIMTRREIQEYPDAIIGIVSEIPDYEEWGGGDRDPVKVNGRIWIKVK